MYKVQAVEGQSDRVPLRAARERPRRFQFTLCFLLGFTAYLAVSIGIVISCRKEYAVTLLETNYRTPPLIYLPPEYFDVRVELLRMALESDRAMELATQKLTTKEGATDVTISNLSSASAVSDRVRIKHPYHGLWTVMVEVRGSRKEAASIAAPTVPETVMPWPRFKP